jgi:hypothetical protein
LLAQGAHGRASSDPADHRAALVLLRELKAAGEDGYDQRIITATLYAGDAAGLTTFAQSLPDSPARRRALVAAAALTSGDEAVRVATALASGSARVALLDAWIQDLLPLRRYDALRAVARARPALSARHRVR